MPLDSALYRMLLNDYLCFCTGAQPVGGGAGAGWRGCCSGEAATRSSPVPVRFYSGDVMVIITVPVHILFSNRHNFYL